MKRFRFTLLAVCLVLLYLGYADLRLFFENPEPRQVSIETLATQGPPQEWMKIMDGYLKLSEAISTSGTLEIDALLVPLVSVPEQETFHVLVETRDPAMIETFSTYYFSFDTTAEQKAYRHNNPQRFLIQRPVRGMVQGSLIASSNQDRLRQLAETSGLNVPEEVLFVSEGKEPPRYRGFIFTALALLGLIKFITLKNKQSATQSLAQQ